MTIYDQVEKLLNTSAERPNWVDEILYELREIKTVLKNNNRKQPRDKAYFEFVNNLRQKMRASIVDGIYPEIYYQDKVFGINFKGWIYDKESTKVLPALKAFEVYRFLYNQQENIDKFLKI